MDREYREYFAYYIVWGPEIEGVTLQCLMIPRYPGLT